LKKMTSLLQRKGVKLENMASTIIEGGEHNEKLWSKNFPEAYQWLITNNE
jgi:hypothetical protein